MAEGNAAHTRWQDELYDLLRRHNVTQFAYVPDAGHRIRPPAAPASAMRCSGPRSRRRRSGVSSAANR
jgi:hypothetical protein